MLFPRRGRKARFSCPHDGWERLENLISRPWHDWGRPTGSRAGDPAWLLAFPAGFPAGFFVLGKPPGEARKGHEATAPPQPPLTGEAGLTALKDTEPGRLPLALERGALIGVVIMHPVELNQGQRSRPAPSNLKRGGEASRGLTPGGFEPPSSMRPEDAQDSRRHC